MWKVRLFIWRLLWSDEKQKQKKEHWISKQINRLIQSSSGGGFIGMTFWQKVKMIFVLLLLVGGSVVLYFSIMFSAVR